MCWSLLLLSKWLRLEPELSQSSQWMTELQLILLVSIQSKIQHNAGQVALHTVDMLIFVQCVNSSKSDSLKRSWICSMLARNIMQLQRVQSDVPGFLSCPLNHSREWGGGGGGGVLKWWLELTEVTQYESVELKSDHNYTTIYDQRACLEKSFEQSLLFFPNTSWQNVQNTSAYSKNEKNEELLFRIRMTVQSQNCKKKKNETGVIKTPHMIIRQYSIHCSRLKTKRYVGYSSSFSRFPNFILKINTFNRGNLFSLREMGMFERSWPSTVIKCKWCVQSHYLPPAMVQDCSVHATTQMLLMLCSSYQQ